MQEQMHTQMFAGVCCSAVYSSQSGCQL